MKKTIVMAAMLMLAGCSSDFDNGYSDGYKAGFEKGIYDALDFGMETDMFVSGPITFTCEDGVMDNVKIIQYLDTSILTIKDTNNSTFTGKVLMWTTPEIGYLDISGVLEEEK